MCHLPSYQLPAHPASQGPGHGSSTMAGSRAQSTGGSAQIPACPLGSTAMMRRCAVHHSVPRSPACASCPTHPVPTVHFCSNSTNSESDRRQIPSLMRHILSDNSSALYWCTVQCTVHTMHSVHYGGPKLHIPASYGSLGKPSNTFIDIQCIGNL